MLFRYAVKSLKRYAFMNLLTVVQLVAALTVTAFMVSSVSLRLSRYEPFRREFTGTGRLAVFSSFAHNGDLTGKFTMVNTDKDMSELLGTDVKVIGTHMCSADIRNSDGLKILSADRELIDRYTPPVAAGKWFEGDGICAAVTEGSSYSIGDKIAIEYTASDGAEKQLEARVTAVIKADAKIAGLSGDNDYAQKDTFELFYRSVKDDIGSKGVVLLDESTLPDDLERAYTGSVLLSYSENADEEHITKALYAAGSLYSVSMAAVNKASRGYLLIRLYELVPIIAVLCIMAFVGSISTAALSTRRQLADYAVFTLCGLKKRNCGLIGLIQSIITLAASGVLTAVVTAVIGRIYLNRFYLHTDLFLLTGEAVIAVLFIAVSLAVPTLMIGKSDVRELLKYE